MSQRRRSRHRCWLYSYHRYWTYSCSANRFVRALSFALQLTMKNIASCLFALLGSSARRAPARWPATAARQRPWPSVRELLLLHHHKPGGHHRTRRRTTSLDRSHTMEMYIHETHIRCVAPRRNFCLCGSLAGCGNQRSGAGDISSNGNSVTRWRAGARATLGCGGPTATARPSFQRRALRPPHGCPLA